MCVCERDEKHEKRQNKNINEKTNQIELGNFNRTKCYDIFYYSC